MGADVFENIGTGETAQKAFRSVLEDAQYDSGHGGYSGTIAEKNSLVMIPLEVPEKLAEAASVARNHAEKLLDDCDPRIDDKWGPAGCIALGHNSYLFFGWASS